MIITLGDRFALWWFVVGGGGLLFCLACCGVALLEFGVRFMVCVIVIERVSLT